MRAHLHKKEDYINKIVLKTNDIQSLCARVRVYDFLCFVNIVVMKDQKNIVLWLTEKNKNVNVEKKKSEDELWFISKSFSCKVSEWTRVTSFQDAHLLYTCARDMFSISLNARSRVVFYDGRAKDPSGDVSTARLDRTPTADLWCHWFFHWLYNLTRSLFLCYFVIFVQYMRCPLYFCFLFDLRTCLSVSLCIYSFVNSFVTLYI